MSKSIICFAAILVFASFQVSAKEQCSKSSLIIEQVPTGRLVQSKPEWKVKVTNECVCTFTLIKLSCPKFVAIIAVKPPVITLDSEGHCILKGVFNPLRKGESIEFTYASERIDFKLLDFNVACS